MKRIYVVKREMEGNWHNVTCLCLTVNSRREEDFEGGPGSNAPAAFQTAPPLCEGSRRLLCERWSGTSPRLLLCPFMISLFS